MSEFDKWCRDYYGLVEEEEKKRLVVRDAVLNSVGMKDGIGFYSFVIPSNAKNVRCSYDVEE